MELLSNNEAGGEEIDNEQVLIYENLIRSINLRNNFKFDNLFFTIQNMLINFLMNSNIKNKNNSRCI